MTSLTALPYAVAILEQIVAKIGPKRTLFDAVRQVERKEGFPPAMPTVLLFIKKAWTGDRHLESAVFHMRGPAAREYAELALELAREAVALAETN